MKRLFQLVLCAVIAASVASGCVLEVESDDLDPVAFNANVGVVRAKLTGTERRARATIIRDAAERRGLTNGVLLGGIADSETGMAHCWSEATWACQGPHSSDCGGPVIAGSGDGPCSHRQGGLGMFQFDAGTYDDTIAREGDRVLRIDGNVEAAVDFVVSMVIRSTFISGVSTEAEALAWMNDVRVGGTHWDDWITTVTAYYNGCWPGSCSVYSSRYDRYSSHTSDVLHEMGEDFWYPPRCEAHCEGDIIVGDDCGRGDCAAYGSGCVDDALGVRCVFFACPPVGTAEVCVSESIVGSCVDGALVSQGDCGAYAAYCSHAGGQPAHCASVFCVESPEAVPVEHEVCLPDGERYHCDSSGQVHYVGCPSGERCSVHGDVHCEAELPCPAEEDVEVCSDDAVVRCMGGGIVDVIDDCAAAGGECSTDGGVGPTCIEVEPEDEVEPPEDETPPDEETPPEEETPDDDSIPPGGDDSGEWPPSSPVDEEPLDGLNGGCSMTGGVTRGGVTRLLSSLLDLV